MFTLLTLYLFCYLGDEITDRFEKISDGFYNLAWYNLPVDMQQCFPMLIAVAHKRVYTQGVTQAHSTRETFLQVFLLSFF